MVADRRNRSLFLHIADHEGAHLAVVAVFAHGVEDDLRLFAVGVAHVRLTGGPLFVFKKRAETK